MVSKNTINEIKFKKPHEAADKFIDIIAPAFGLSTGTKIIFKSRLKLSKEKELRQCLIDVLKFLAVEYKK